MLAVEFAFVFLMNGTGMGQSFTPVPYQFSNVPGRNSDGYTNYLNTSLNTNSHSKQNINFTGAASNNYGTWSVDDAGNWYLLSNLLNDESTTSIVPSGIVATGAFYPHTYNNSNNVPTKDIAVKGEVKVAANLNGNVRYVWINHEGNFVIQGLDPVGYDNNHGTLNQGAAGRGLPLNQQTQIDISIPTGYPNADKSREIIKGTEDATHYRVTDFGVINWKLDINGNGIGANICNSSSIQRPSGFQEMNGEVPPVLVEEPDNSWEHDFDIAIDQNFLYLVWQASAPTCGNECATCNQVSSYIFAVAIDLKTGLPLFNNTTGCVFPWAMINLSIWSCGNPMTVKNAVRPTVACNVRNAPSTPDFDVACITGHLTTWPINHDAQVAHSHVTYNSSTQKYIFPNIQANATTYINQLFNFNGVTVWPSGPQATFCTCATDPRSARILVSSAKGQTTPVKACYVIESMNVASHADRLIFYKFVDGQESNVGKYIDGFDISASHACGNATAVPGRSASSFSPVDPYFKYEIINNPVQAFANPYDGQNSGNYDEFHCVYQITSEGTDCGHTYADGNPLVIVRGANNGMLGTTDTRQLVNREKPADNWLKLPDPTFTPNNVPFFPLYSASVNQMGIHVYWRDQNASTVFYSRDLRKFDEDIEENTLLTGACTIDDGGSHAGTNGATLQPNKTLAFWTDLNFNSGALYARNFSSSDSWNNAQLHFGYTTNNTALNIGTNSTSGSGQSSNNKATLILPPNFEIHFSPSYLSSNSLRNAININPSSTLEYYGIPSSTDPPIDELPKQNFFGEGAINILGKSANLVNVTSDGKGSHPSSDATHTDALTFPANLNIHSGSELQIPAPVTLKCSASFVNYFFESPILPIHVHNTTLEQSRSGFIDLIGTGNFDASIIGNSPSTSFPSTGGKLLRAIVCKPTQLINTENSGIPVMQLLMTNCLLGLDHGSMQVSCNTKVSNALDNVFSTNGVGTFTDNERIYEISGGLFNSATVFIANPWNAPYNSPYGVGGTNTVSVIDGAFVSALVSLFRSDDNTSDYHNILIDHNEFTNGGCKVQGFAADLEWTWTDDNMYSHVVNRINITDNKFTGGDVGILSINSNIAAGNNTITNVATGILQTQENAQDLPPNTSFFCNNTINGCDANSQNCSGIGMQLDNWADYIKLSDISTCDIGIKLMDKVNGGFLDWSYIKNCKGQGLLFHPNNSSRLAKLTVAKNTIELNNTAVTADIVSGQIEIDDGGLLRIGGGRNNIVRQFPNPTPKDDKFIFHPGTSSMPIGFNNNSGDDKVHNNYWADNRSATTSPYDFYVPQLTSTDQNPDGNFFLVTYSDGSLESGHDHEYYTFSGVYCSSGIPSESSKPKATTTFSVQDDCTQLINEADSFNEGHSYQKAYEAYKTYIESCAYLLNSWTTFSDVGTMNVKRTSDLSRNEEYREWLKKVLYFSPDTNYYCADVGEILTTFSWFNNIRGRDHRGALAVLNFIVNTNRCPKLTAYYDTIGIPATWNQLYSAWQDSVKDSILTPFDSTLPTLEDLDLGILRGKPADVKNYFDKKYGAIISNIIALENPFSSETKINFTCREAAAIKMEIFDVLGKSYYKTEKVFEQGENQIILPGEGLPHGMLYARFSASDGTVKTIVLRHVE